jgi:predicted  nucleic acid-binding Zn-ribbon protein
MAATASTLRELHQLHQRAKALRDRLVSAPKTLAARQAALATKQASLETARKAVQDARLKIKSRETHVQSLNTKIDDLKVKLNTVKKNDEYKALQNQIAHDKAAIAKIEDEILDAMGQVESQAAEVAKFEAEVKSFGAEVSALAGQIEAQAGDQKSQLAALEAAIVAAEEVIPEDDRDRYRRTVKQKGADALAAIESGACSHCYVEVTHQMMNELINKNGMTFCMTCGCILYLAEEDMPNTRRSSR